MLTGCLCPGTKSVATRPSPRSQDTRGQAVRPIPLEDFELIEKVKAGQTEAYADLVRKYQDRVFNTCWRICGHLEDARDLTQEAFLKAFENITAFRQQSGFYTWVFRVAVNLALSHRRKETRRRTMSLDQQADAAGTQAAELVAKIDGTGGGDPATAAGQAELRGLALRALNGLDEDHRAVLVLREIEGMNYTEIGEILDIPPGTVRSRLHRARMALRAAILPWLSGEL